MKRMTSLLLLAGLALSACGSAPPQISGNGRVSIGVDADDAASRVDVTRSYTPATTDDKGNVTPAKETWTVSEGGPATFTFMSRPGSDAAYIVGYRFLKYDYNGRDITSSRTVEKLDLYVPSGYTCPERASLPSYHSCSQFNTDGSMKSDAVPANGLPVQMAINLASALASEVQATRQNAASVVNLEFFGYSANNQPVSVIVKDVVSRAYKLGD